MPPKAKEKETIDYQAIATRMEAEHFSSNDNKLRWKKEWPDMHFFLASKTGPDKAGTAGGQVKSKEQAGYVVLSDDPSVTGHVDMVLMGVPEQAWQIIQQQIATRSEAGMRTQPYAHMKAVVDVGDREKLEDAVSVAQSNEGWDGEVLQD